MVVIHQFSSDRPVSGVGHPPRSLLRLRQRGVPCRGRRHRLCGLLGEAGQPQAAHACPDPRRSYIRRVRAAAAAATVAAAQCATSYEEIRTIVQSGDARSYTFVPQRRLFGR